MAINRVEIKDFLVFRGEFAVDFCPGVNVLIGGNGTGKTTLLKVMYRLCGNGKNRDTGQYFFGNGMPFSPFNHPFEYIRMLVIAEQSDTRICVRNVYCDGPDPDNAIYTDGAWILYNPDKYLDEYTKTKSLTYSRMSTDLVFASENYTPLQSVFIPAINLLPNSRSLLEMLDEFKLDFDVTQFEIVKNARRAITNLLKPNCSKVIDRLTSTIGGEVVYEDDNFYLVKNSGRKVEFALEASGFTRLGVLWKLLRNGQLESGTILFWDEPENSLNPEHVPTLVDVLLELSRNGVQIFLATHSEILASYINALRKNGDSVMFFSLFKDDDKIKYDQDERFDLLKPNNLIAEQAKLYETEVERVLG